MLKALLLKTTHIIPDALYLKLRYYMRFHKRLNLKNPRTYNEKTQWLKLYDRKREYINLVDKAAVKDYVAERIGKQYIIPTLGVWDRFDDIDFDSLPDKFVLKCTHDSGGVFICTNKAEFDIEKVRKEITTRLRTNYYWHTREWLYKSVKPRIIAEKYMVDESGVELKDYKVFCFGGQVKLIHVDFDRFAEHKRNVYSPEWELQDVGINYPRDPKRIIQRPDCLDEMVSLASKLSADIPHVRADFYIIKDKIYFGELTFYHASGFAKYTPAEWDKKIGDWIKLPPKSR